MHIVVTPDGNRKRIDAWLATQIPELSRARIQSLIQEGNVHVNQEATHAHRKLQTGQSIEIVVPPPVSTDVTAENIPLSIVFEDQHILVLNKPAGLVVHPAAGHASGTLVNALLNHCKDLAGIGGTLRPGIVHRLDKDTSGLMVVAKSEPAMKGLVDQFKNGKVLKTYHALVRGTPSPPNGRIETLIGRDRLHRNRMSTKPQQGRPAISEYQVIQSFKLASLMGITIHTGRTHQIRVHMTHLGHPILGDPVYGQRTRTLLPDNAPPLKRQLLHAAVLSFSHPVGKKALHFESTLPVDMAAVLSWLTTAIDQPPAKM